ncbi:MAG: S8 family serine peptidase [Streptosporangiaceae bacterium]
MIRLAAAGAAVLLAVATTAAPAAADSVRDRQWPVLSGLNVQRAWNVTKGGGVTVALLDSGVDPLQEDLVGTVTEGPDLTEGANPPGVVPRRLHGTNMASIIAGHGHGFGNADGVMGVAPEARILSLRIILENEEPGFGFFNSDSRYDDVISQGIHYAVDHGARVINMSLGKPLPTKRERQAIAYAISRGVVVVAAAGNDGASLQARKNGHAPFSFPASFPGVISVAAVDADHRHAGFSNRNSAVLVSAPGVDIIGAGPDSTYWVGDGTSPATAFVSGIVALVRSKYPALPPALVTQAIIGSAAHRPGRGYDLGVGFGEVDAAGALAEAARLNGFKMTGAGADPARPLGIVRPVRVVHHDTRLIITSAVVGLLGLTGLVGFGLLAARRRVAL